MSFEYNRPRRPSPDTLSYLRSLPLEERVSDEEVKAYMDFFTNKNNNKDDDQQEMMDEPEYPRVLSAALSAIDEIKNEVASLAGDEYGSECIEVLTRVGAKYSAFAAKSLLEGVAGYYLHLATHRYGSHVLQTIIQLATKGCGDDYDYSESQLASTLELEEGDDHTTTSSLQNLIISAVEELLPYVPNLAVHICGSHVLRTLLCALSGVELVTTSQLSSNTNDTNPIRRGKAKKKKKKKKKPTDEPSNNSSNPGLIQLKKLQTTRINVLDPNVQKAFHSLVDAISMVSPDNSGTNSSSGQGVSPPGEFQQLACHPSASPLLIVVLRVLIEVDENNKPLNTDETKEDGKDFFKLGIIPPQPQFQPNSRAEDFAKSIICWDSDPTAKDQKYAGDIIYGLSGESRGSHMLETLLRTANDTFYDAICKTGDFFNPSTFNDYIAHDVSNFVIQTLLSTVRTKSQAESLLQCIQPSIENGYILHSTNKRRGVLWRTVEMAAKFGVGQETIQNCIKVGFSTNNSSDNNNGTKEVTSKEDNQDTKEEEDGKKRRKKRPITSSISMEECIPKLLDIKPPEYDGGRVGLDVAGTRTIHHLLKFAPRLCGDVLNGIINNLSQQELEWIINDGLGSRCIIDGVLDGRMTEKIFSKFVRKLLEKMAGRWVSLSVERVGHHTVRKVFSALKSVDDKATLSAELAGGINRLNGTSMGRSTIASCFVKEFLEGQTVWSEAVKKLSEKEKFVKDFIENDDVNATSKKRKRRRKKASSDP